MVLKSNTFIVFVPFIFLLRGSGHGGIFMFSFYIESIWILEPQAIEMFWSQIQVTFAQRNHIENTSTLFWKSILYREDILHKAIAIAVTPVSRWRGPVSQSVIVSDFGAIASSELVILLQFVSCLTEHDCATFITPDIRHTLCTKGYSPHQTLTTH